jgi:hypothetical protein
MKNAIVSTALESLETPFVDPTAAEQAAAMQVAASTDSSTQELQTLSKDKLLLNAPLSVIFTRALNIKYAKTDEGNGQYEGIEPAGIAVESQQTDLYYALASTPPKSNFEGAREGDPTEPTPKAIDDVVSTANGSGTMLSTPVTHEELVRFVNSNDFAEANLDTQFVFYKTVEPRTDGLVNKPWNEMGMILLNEGAGKENYVVESIEIVVKTRKVDLDD